MKAKFVYEIKSKSAIFVIKGVQIMEFTCSVCRQTVEYKSDSTIGYGISDKGQKVCYACCAIEDKAKMIETGKAVLYLTFGEKEITVSNWPGSLKIIVSSYTVGRHNWGLKRYDVWFLFNSYVWHGVTYGDNTQLCHCKRAKKKA